MSRFNDSLIGQATNPTQPLWLPIHLDQGETQKVVRPSDTRAIVLDHMSFDQDAGSISDWNVASGETRRSIEIPGPQLKVSVVDEFEIPRDHVSGSFSRRRNLTAKDASLPLEHARVYSRVVLMMVSDVAAIVRSIGYVTINKEVGLPFIP